MAKVSKADASYTQTGMPQSHCGICAHFVAPNLCEKVEGTVSRSGWCKLFKRRPKRGRGS